MTMFDKRIDTYDRTNFRKRLNEFLNTAEEFKRSDINEHNINQILTEVLICSLYNSYLILN